MKVRFLIIRFSSIGDIVLTSPVIRAIKTQIPNAEVHFVTKARYANLLINNPNISKIHILENKMKPLLRQLVNENFDYIIDLHNNFRSRQIKLRLKARSFSYNKLNIKKWMLVSLKINLLPDLHVVDRYMQTLRFFNLKDDARGLEFFIPEDQHFDLSLLPSHFTDGYIAFALGGTYFTKRLPLDKIIEICSKIKYPVVLLGGADEFETGEQIRSRFPEQTVNLCGKTSIHASASLIKQSRLVLTNDTGLMHIASAFKKDILSFWGNTTPAFGMTPYMPGFNSTILQVDKLGCRPCSKLGYKKCPKGHFRCMGEIDTDVAIGWINSHF
jgi:ADP-heptose:LPS heptosyltransferase